MVTTDLARLPDGDIGRPVGRRCAVRLEGLDWLGGGGEEKGADEAEQEECGHGSETHFTAGEQRLSTLLMGD